MAIFTIGALSLIGIPPMAGFISKFYLMKGAVEADMLPIAFVYAGSSFLNACYFLPIIYIAYFKPLSEDLKPGYKEAPVMMLVSMMITSFMVFVLFFFPKILTSFADIVAAGMR